MLKRPIVILTLGWIIGILFGLYCNISIALFVLFFLYSYAYFILKNKVIEKYNMVLKIKKTILWFLISILISCIFTNIKDQEYEDKIEQIKKEGTYTGIIISNAIKKEYSTQYKLKITKIRNKSVDIIVYIRIKGRNNLQYGDEISFKGQYSNIDIARNDKGFDYKKYLKSNRDCRCNNN